MSDIYRTAPVPTLGESYEIGRAHGVRAEQERIIKLLDSLKGTCDGDCDECRPYAICNAHYLTALQDLIKGENK